MTIPLGHAPYVAYSVGGVGIGLSARLSFTKKAVDVYSYVTNNVQTYSVAIPFCSAMPLEVGLYRERAIRWLLQEGYQPCLVGREVTFVAKDDLRYVKSPQLNELLSCCDAVIEAIHDSDDSFIRDTSDEDEPLCDLALVTDFKRNLEQQKLAFARDCIERARRYNRHSRSLLELYADFLYYLGDKEAANCYLELANDRSLAFAEKALLANPLHKEALELLERLSKSAAQVVHYFMYALCHAAGSEYADELYYKILQIAPNEPLVYFARLAGCTSDKMRQELSGTLALLYEKRQQHASEPVAPKKREILYCDCDDELVEAINKETKHAFLALADTHIERCEFAEAEGVLVQAERRSLSKGSFLKKRFEMYGVSQALLEQLWDLYFAKGSFQKAELVARTLEKRELGLKVGLVLAQQAKVAEGARHYYSMLKLALRQGAADLQERCLGELKLLDPTLRTLHETERLVVHAMTGANMPASCKKTGRIVCQVQENICSEPMQGRYAFSVDHPEYVACFVDIRKKMLFTSKEVRIFSHQGALEKVYPLLIPSHSALPDEVALFTRKTIVWFLLTGYQPVVVGEHVTFLSRRKAFLARNDLPQQFRRYFEERQYSLALCWLQDGGGSKELLADYFVFLQKPVQASALYLELMDLPKALILDQARKATYKVEYPEELLSTLYLFAYLYQLKMNPKRAEQIYVLAEHHNPQDPFIRLAYLATISTSSKIERLMAYKRLAELDDIGAYYRENRIANPTAAFFAEKSKKVCLKVIDNMFDASEYAEALQALDASVGSFLGASFVPTRYQEEVGQRFYGEGRSFLKREVIASLKLGDTTKLAQSAASLIALYTVSGKLLKSLAIQSLEHTFCRTVTSANRFAHSLFQANFFRQSVELYLDNLFYCLNNNMSQNAIWALEKCIAIDKTHHVLTEAESDLLFALSKQLMKK